MKTKAAFIKVSILMISLIITLSACGKSNEYSSTNEDQVIPFTSTIDNFSGRWIISDSDKEEFEHDGAYQEMVLFSDGSCNVSARNGALGIQTGNGKWEIIDGKFKVTNANGGDFLTMETLFSNYQIEDNTLILTDVNLGRHSIDAITYYKDEDF